MYLNRELSWLKFNERVLMEATNESLPLLERLKYSAIFSSNLDEFFMVRVATILEQIDADYVIEDNSGFTPMDVFLEIKGQVDQLVVDQHKVTSQCLKLLEESNIQIIRKKTYDSKLKKKLRQIFDDEIFPILTPMAVDFSRPFPFIRNNHLYLVCKLSIEGVHKLALVQIPTNYPRLIPIKNNLRRLYVLLEDVIEAFIDDLFVGYEIISTSLFRITRNADLALKHDADDLLMVIEQAVKNRQRGEAVRLEVHKKCDPWLINNLMAIYNLNDNQVYRIPGLMDMTLWLSFNPKKMTALKSVDYQPKSLTYIDEKNMFKEIQKKDLFIHHPYESFDYVLNFVKQASIDPKVLAIKQTLYRVSGDSEIIACLGQAAENGKQVTVLLELKARFDEKNNIEWAKKLEKKGVHVIYGLYGYKTHSKITLVVRKEHNRIKRYVHLSTGNYNDKTAKLYTDMSYMTCKETYGTDATLFFNTIFGFSNSIDSQYMKAAPYDLRDEFYRLIDNEIAYKKKGLIIAKMNALVDKGIIDKLYQASQAGVTIQLIVRGICTLCPQVKGLSDNIYVKSIIGEFLEHSRVYYFKHAERPVYLSSADWMTRNLNRRIELLFPVDDTSIVERVKTTLDLYLADDTRSWRLEANGQYQKIDTSKHIDCQKILKTIEYEDHESFINHLNDMMLG